MNGPAGLPIEPGRRVLHTGAPGAWTVLSCSHKLPQGYLGDRGALGPGQPHCPWKQLGALPSSPTELSRIVLDDCGEGFSAGPVGRLMTVSVVWIANVSQSSPVPSAQPPWGRQRVLAADKAGWAAEQHRNRVIHVCGRQGLCLRTAEQRGLKEPRPLSFPTEICLAASAKHQHWPFSEFQQDKVSRRHCPLLTAEGSWKDAHSPVLARNWINWSSQPTCGVTPLWAALPRQRCAVTSTSLCQSQSRMWALACWEGHTWAEEATSYPFVSFKSCLESPRD